jgi:hypothetical protein
MSVSDDDQMREHIGRLLADGLKTQSEPLPESEREYSGLLEELRRLPPKDLAGKLVVSGFTGTPYGEEEMRCQECMHYLVHRKWCDLPELALPVEPNWWCRLWRM